ncbi:maleylpyruvate isomerase N-terminal domain-containing protein [Nocardia takedensis]|uniref:maleylpyruvate isomerase N-terminal domain-containing protein n=1 Tax=Nocardia takedensis TaxID=259390 RepID=UPI0002EFB635|nr:maleylpyruvate isomerase N-terminal domain-containing protein [Nocardia takedensis]
MTGIRGAYLEATASVLALLRDPAVGAAWERPSVLKEFSVRGLAGHVGSQVFHVARALSSETPADPPSPSSAARCSWTTSS